MISLFMAIFSGLFGCQKPSPEVASMLGEPQGEEAKRALAGVAYKLEGTRITIGTHQLDVFPYIEHCANRDAAHICGVRFEISDDGKKDSAWTYGVVGNGTSREAALRNTVQGWWAEFGIPLLFTLSNPKTDFGEWPFLFYPGSLGIRGTPPGGWLDGTEAMIRKITPTLRPLVNQRPNTKTLLIKLIISPEGVKDLGCRMDGQLSRELFDAVSTLPWPKASPEYMLTQTYFVVRRSERNIP